MWHGLVRAVRQQTRRQYGCVCSRGPPTLKGRRRNGRRRGRRNSPATLRRDGNPSSRGRVLDLGAVRPVSVCPPCWILIITKALANRFFRRKNGRGRLA